MPRGGGLACQRRAQGRVARALVTALTGLIFFTVCPGVAPLHAGSAQPGGIRPAILDDSRSSLARRLVGRWKMIQMESGGKPIPVPASVQYLLILAADGTARVEMGQAKARVLGRWQVKGRRLILQTSRTSKTELVDIQIKRDRLTIQTQGSSRGVRLVLKRVKEPRRR